jgi:hypothetical protein
MFAWKLHIGLAAAFLLVSVSARADDAQATLVVSSAESGEAGAVAVANPGDYWLGVVVAQTSPAMQSQLKLPKGQGLLVEALQPGGPAAKAGIQQHDILLKANDKPLTDLRDLVEVIGKVKDGKISLDLLRAGKHETAVVSPTKRPEGADIGVGSIRVAEGNAVPGWMPKPDVIMGEDHPMQLHVIHPGQILPPGAPMPGLADGETNVEITVHSKTRLPDGWQVEVTRHGLDPAKVIVTRDKEKWEGTANDLSKIPEKVRPEVEKLLHPTGDNFRFFAAPGNRAGGAVTVFGGSAAMPMGAGHLAASSRPDLQQQVGEMKKQLGEMQKQVDELRRTVEELQKKAR